MGTCKSKAWVHAQNKQKHGDMFGYNANCKTCTHAL